MRASRCEGVATEPEPATGARSSPFAVFPGRASEGGIDDRAANATQAEKRHTATPLLPADRIGIQLYSVRDQIDAIGFARVFETLARIGYKQVEFAGYTQAVGRS